MNKAILIGNLCADPELRKTESGISVCTFRIAVQRNVVNAQGVREADFLSVTAWRELGENCAKYLTKGRKCAVEGRIQTRSYTAQDGSKRTATEILAERVEFLNGPREGTPAPTDDDAPPEKGQFEEIDDDDLPF